MLIVDLPINTTLFILFTSSGIPLWAMDNEHPSWEGTYLAACTLYGTLFSESPLGMVLICFVQVPSPCAPHANWMGLSFGRGSRVVRSNLDDGPT